MKYDDRILLKLHRDLSSDERTALLYERFEELLKLRESDLEEMDGLKKNNRRLSEANARVEEDFNRRTDKLKLKVENYRAKVKEYEKVIMRLKDELVNADSC